MEQNFNESNLPLRYRPLSAWKYFGLNILFSIPVIGFIFLVIFSISRANINRRNYARSFFCIYALILIVAIIAVALGWSTGLMGLLASYLQ